MSTPYIGFTNETLGKLPKATEGQLINCPKCKGRHRLNCATSDGKKCGTLMFYKCGKESYLGAVGGRLVVDIKSDVSGEVDMGETQ